MRRRALLVGLAGCLAGSLLAKPAAAKAKVEILAVEFADEAASKALQKRVKSLVRNKAAASAKHLKFGTSGKVGLTLRVKELTLTEESADLLRVSCVLVGKLRGGGSARSKLSFAGKPERRKKLLALVLGSTTDGVMTRLAQLARERETSDKG